jgi:hypothetical protein
MADASTKTGDPTPAELDQMHAVYRHGGGERHMAPHIVYSDPLCPHPGCGQRMQAIDFQLEAYGPGIHDPLVRAWWNDTGFAGRCPLCGGWIHFTIRGKQPISAEEAARLPQLPDDWHHTALIL